MLVKHSAWANFVNFCVSKLIIDDKYLIEHAVDERALAFRLGHYLQCCMNRSEFLSTAFKGATVDAEYSKHGINPKCVYGACKSTLHCEPKECFIFSHHANSPLDLEINQATATQERKSASTLLQYVQTVTNHKRARPDLLIHFRCSTPRQYGQVNKISSNLVVIEIKLNRDDISRKRYEQGSPNNETLIDFAKLTYLTCPHGEYNYGIGIHITFFQHDPENPKYEYFELGCKLT